MAHEMANTVTEAMKPGQASPPSVIANVISQAAKSSKPKTRYAAGKMAKLVLRARSFLSDRAFDKMILKRLGVKL